MLLWVAFAEGLELDYFGQHNLKPLLIEMNATHTVTLQVLGTLTLN